MVLKNFQKSLRLNLILGLWRAMCVGVRDEFTAAFWSAITSDSALKVSSCRDLSEQWNGLKVCSSLHCCILLCIPLYHGCSPIHKGHDDLTWSPPSSNMSLAVFQNGLKKRFRSFLDWTKKLTPWADDSHATPVYHARIGKVLRALSN